MIASAHIAAGLVAGLSTAYLTEKRAARIGIALAMGFLTHVMLDALPHSDYAPLSRQGAMLVASFECLGMIALGVALMRPRVLERWPEYVIPALAGATLPDLKFFARVFLPKKMEITIEYYGNWLHSYFHVAPTPPALGWTVEIICLIALLGLLIAFPRHAPSARPARPRDR